MTDAERIAALMEVLNFIVDSGGSMMVYEIDPAKLPPGLMSGAEAVEDRRELPDWKDRS